MSRRAPDPRRDRLTVLHRDRQRAVTAAVGARLAAALRNLPDVSDESSARYVAQAVPVIVAGQRTAATLAAGYVRALAPATGPLERPVDLTLGDLAVTADTAWVASPIIRARAKLAAGNTYLAAIDAAASYAEGLASGDLAVAQRLGLEAAAGASGAGVRGWVKEADGAACRWCQDVAQGVYSSAESVPFHDNDRCSVAPLFDA